MARKARKARVNPVDWKLDGQKQGDLWRVVDGTGDTIGLINDDLVLAVFAYRHLLDIAKTARGILKGLGALDVNWANTDHIITGRGVGQLTPDMLKTGLWRSLVQVVEPETEELPPISSDYPKQDGLVEDMLKVGMVKDGTWKELTGNVETVSGVPESGGAGEPAGADPVSDPGSPSADSQDENG